MTTLEKLQLFVDAAMDDDKQAEATLRLIGETVHMSAGVQGLLDLQGKLHDAAVDRWKQGSRGDAIGNFWEHIPQWSAL